MMMNEQSEHVDDRPAWLRDAWDRVVAPLVAASLARQEPDDREKLHAALDAGCPIDFDVQDGKVVFGIDGTGFCEISVAALTGVPTTSTQH